MQRVLHFFGNLKLFKQNFVFLQSIEVPVRNQSHLKQRFPVSSGQQHLVLEWIPVTDCGKPPIGTELLSEEARTATGTPSPWLTKPTSLPLTQMGSSGNTNPLTGEATPKILNWSGEPQVRHLYFK